MNYKTNFKGDDERMCCENVNERLGKVCNTEQRKKQNEM